MGFICGGVYYLTIEFLLVRSILPKKGDLGERFSIGHRGCIFIECGSSSFISGRVSDCGDQYSHG